MIKRCLKINIRKIYLFGNEGEGEKKKGPQKIVGGVLCALREFKAGEFQEHKSRRQKKSSLYIFFIISILKTNYFFPAEGRRVARRGADFFFFFSLSVFSPLFSVFFNRCKND